METILGMSLSNVYKGLRPVGELVIHKTEKNNLASHMILKYHFNTVYGNLKLYIYTLRNADLDEWIGLKLIWLWLFALRLIFVASKKKIVIFKSRQNHSWHNHLIIKSYHLATLTNDQPLTRIWRFGRFDTSYLSLRFLCFIFMFRTWKEMIK